MRLKRAVIENYRAISRLELDFHPQMNVFFGGNAEGKTSVLSAIATGFGAIQRLLPAITSVNFLERDRRGTEPIRVELEACDGAKWERTLGGPRRAGRLDDLRKRLEPLLAAEEDKDPSKDLPLAVFYDTDRVVPERPQRLVKPRDFPRFEALEGALSPRPNFRTFFEWFAGREHEEGNEQKRRRSFDFHLPALRAVRRAVEALVPGVSDPTVMFHPVRFTVSAAFEGDPSMRVEICQVGGGHRIVLALAADLARRMAQANPHLDDPLQSEAVVLIDEVELHLHPSWQQRILPDLMRVFPNAQFLVATNSAQVLTTVEPDRLLQLAREDGEIVVGGVVSPTYGAPAGFVLSAVMGVRQRPSGNEFVRLLDEYWEFVNDGRGETEEALRLRGRLEAISPHDSDLDATRSEMNRQRVLTRLGREVSP